MVRQKRKSFHLDNDGVDDSIAAAAAELSMLMMEKEEVPSDCTKSSKSVHFAEVIESHESDKTQEEVACTWLTRYDIALIRGSNTETARLISVGHPSLAKSEELCARGLEHRDPERFKERRANRRDAFGAVMKELDRQLEESVTDVEATSRVYRQFTLACRVEARERGMSDAKAAAAAIAGPSASGPRAIKKPFHVPRFFKRTKQVVSANKRSQFNATAA